VTSYGQFGAQKLQPSCLGVFGDLFFPTYVCVFLDRGTKQKKSGAIKITQHFMCSRSIFSPSTTFNNYIMSSNNHKAYVAIPMNVFDSYETAPEASSSSRRRNCCRTLWSRDNRLVSMFVLVVGITLAIILIPLLISMMRGGKGFMKIGGKGCMRHHQMYYQDHDSNTLEQEDFIVMEYPDEFVTEKATVYEDDDFFVEEEEEEEVWVATEYDSDDDFEFDMFDDDDMLDESVMLEEAVGEPLQFFSESETKREELATEEVIANEDEEPEGGK